MDDMQLSHRDNWVISIKKEFLKEYNGRNILEEQNRCCTIFRVPKFVKNRAKGKNLTVYTPEGISLGLFHTPGRYDAPKRGEKFKLKMAVAFLTSKYHASRNRSSASSRLGSSGNDSEWKTDMPGMLWRDLCEFLGGRDVLKFRACYDLHEDDILKGHEPEEVVKCALTLDAIIVACLFWVPSYKDNEMKKFPFKAIKACAEELTWSEIPREDFLKLENQIPLDLIGNVLQMLTSETTKDEHLNHTCAFLVKSLLKYLPGYDFAQDLAFIDGLEDKKEFLKCHHLLHCVAIVLQSSEDNDRGLNEEQGQWTTNLSNMIRSSFSNRCLKPDTARAGAPKEGPNASKETSTTPKEGSCAFNIPCAMRLREAGIDVRGRSRGPNSDLLPIFERGWFKAILYIPTLPILPAVTWTLWSNILVYEYEKNRHRKVRDREESQIHAFLALMCCLVDTTEDVLLFTQGANPVLPEGYQSSPELLVEMFNAVLKGLPFAEYPRWVALANQISTYRKQKYRRLVLDTWRKNFGKPWLVVSVIAAIFLLSCAVIQALYAVLAFEQQ